MGKLGRLAAKHKDHAAAKPFFDVLPIDDLLSEKGDTEKDRILIASSYLVAQDYSQGNIIGARFHYLKMGQHVPEFSNMFKSMLAAEAMPDFKGELDEFVKSKFTSGIHSESVVDKRVANQGDLDIMMDRARGRFMLVWAKLKDIDDPVERFGEAQKIVGDEIDLGLQKGQGLFAAQEIKPGNLRLGWTFNSLEARKNAPKKLDQGDIIRFYTNKEAVTSDLKDLNKSKSRTQAANEVNKILVANFKQLITLDEARNLLGELSTGQISNQTDITDNLKTFIANSRSLGYSVTTSDVMNMVIDHIKVNGDKIFKDDNMLDDQFKGFRDQNFEWPVGTDDFVKAVTKDNIVPKNQKDGYASVLKEYFENTLGLDFTQHLIQLYKSRRVN